MTLLRRVLCAMFALAAVVTAVAGWAADRRDITSAEAVTAASDAFTGADLLAQVDSRPLADTYVSRSQAAVAVWKVGALTEEGQVELFLARAGAQPVAIDDRSSDGTAYLLSDTQYAAVASGIEDPSLDRAMRQRVGLTVGAVLIVALAIAHSLVVDPRGRG